MNMKFVRHKTKGFFLFPASDIVWHLHVGKFLGCDELISAGFVRFYKGVPECYGASESLQLGLAADDTQKLRLQLGFEE